MNGWEAIQDMESAKRRIIDPGYLKTNVFEPSADLLQNVDLKGQRVIDFGCGVGRNVPYLLDQGASQVVGYDYPNMIRLAKDYLKECFDQVELVESPITNLQDRDFDIGIAIVSLQHFSRKDLSDAIDQLAFSLRKGILYVYGRGYSDDHENVWQAIYRRFDPVTEIDMADMTERHQKAFFRVRES